MLTLSGLRSSKVNNTATKTIDIGPGKSWARKKDAWCGLEANLGTHQAVRWGLLQISGYASKNGLAIHPPRNAGLLTTE